jgi:hypothetical protein
VLSNRVTAIASTRRRIAGRHHDAPAKHRLRPRDARGLHSEQNGDELTVWRTLNVTRPDGSQGKIDCGNHHAIVYSRK